MSSFQGLCGYKSHFLLGWKITLWRDVLQCGKGSHDNDFLLSSFQPMKPLKAAATTSQPVLTSQQIETIFFKVPELYEIHKEFYDGLLPRVQQWSHQQRVGDLFQKLVSQLPSPKVLVPLTHLTGAGGSLWWLHRAEGSKSVTGIDERFLTSSLCHCSEGPTAKVALSLSLIKDFS